MLEEVNGYGQVFRTLFDSLLLVLYLSILLMFLVVLLLLFLSSYSSESSLPPISASSDKNPNFRRRTVADPNDRTLPDTKSGRRRPNRVAPKIKAKTQNSPLMAKYVILNFSSARGEKIEE
jgi:hypothetical protein